MPSSSVDVFHLLNNSTSRYLPGYFFATLPDVAAVRFPRKTRALPFGTPFAIQWDGKAVPPACLPPSLGTMHSRFLVDVAAISANQSQTLLFRTQTANQWRGEQFWALSRARMNLWMQRMKRVRAWQENQAELDATTFWNDLEPVLEEVFYSEVCTRIWCALLASADHHALPGELDPIARSVFVTCLEVRRQALRLLLYSRGIPQINATPMNRMRYECELWTDQLLARIEPLATAYQFCFEKKRLKQTSKWLKQQGNTRDAYQGWNAFLTGLSSTLSGRLGCEPVCADLNADLCAVLLGCLPDTSFDGTGQLRDTFRIDAFQGDLFSMSVLAELCGEELPTRYRVPGRAGDR